MGAATLLPFTTTTTLQLRGNRMISQGNQLQCRGTNSCRASLRIRCSSNPASTTGVGINAIEVRNSDSSSAKREQQLLPSQCSEDTHLQSRRPRAVKAAATTTEAMTTECEWDVYCDILPDSCDCQTHLHLTSSTWQTCETATEAEASELLLVLGSKKQLRLSFLSWDLFD